MRAEMLCSVELLRTSVLFWFVVSAVCDLGWVSHCFYKWLKAIVTLTKVCSVFSTFTSSTHWDPHEWLCILGFVILCENRHELHKEREKSSSPVGLSGHTALMGRLTSFTVKLLLWCYSMYSKNLCLYGWVLNFIKPHRVSWIIYKR